MIEWGYYKSVSAIYPTTHDRDMKLTEEAKYFEGRYADGSVQLYEGLTYKQRDIIKLADFYSLSRYTTGQKDELSRDKPFFNTVNFRVTLAKTATEFDIKDFRASSDDSQAWVKTMLLNRELYKWMKKTRFSRFLNKYAYVRPKYGGVLYKKVFKELDGAEELCLEVCDWRNTFTDQVDITGSPIIEKHYLSPLDFYAKKGVWDNVDEALELFDEKRAKYGDDQAPDRLEVWEVTGVMSENVYRDAQGKAETKSGDHEYSLQKHFVLVDDDRELVFYSTKPKELGYRYLAWEEVPGRGLGRGIIEDSEEGQVWVNDLVIKQKNTMDIAGKVLIKTDADNIASNILEVDDGKIFKLEEGRDMAAIQLAPAALGNFSNIIEMWNSQMDKQSSTFDANTGEQPPSGTPYSQTALLNQVAQRPFAFRQEEAGIDLEEAFNDWVIPHIIKRLEGEHLLAEEFDEEELKIIDESFGNKMAREVAKEMLLNFQQFTQEDVDQVKTQAIEKTQKSGAKRYIKIPKGYFKGWEGRITLNITNEQQNKANVLQSLSTILQTVSQSYNPQTGTFAILDNPVLSKLFGTIVDTAAVPGISPVSLGLGSPKASKTVTPPATPVSAPQMAPVEPTM